MSVSVEIIAAMEDVGTLQAAIHVSVKRDMNKDQITHASVRASIQS